jgi:hypothetical protein
LAAVDEDQEGLAAAGDRGAHRRVGADVAKPQRVVGRSEPEVAAEEKAVDRSDAGLAAGRDRGEVEDLDADELVAELPRVEPRVLSPDHSQVLSGARVARVQQPLQRS